MFASLDDLRSALAALPQADAAALRDARARDAVLTKPGGALGRLEEIAIFWRGWRGGAAELNAPQIVVFAADHGVAARGVSAFPPEVTAQMVANFAAGGAAINQLARVLGARLDVRDVGVGRPSADFTQAPAMDEARFLAAFQTGIDAVDPQADLLIPGEMGIANTTAAAAVCAALFGGGEDWAGLGTGVDAAGLAAKRAAIGAGLARNPTAPGDPLEALRCLGGLELAAMAGAIFEARRRRIPVVLDGFICCAAAAALHCARRDALDHCLAGHVSAEGAHARLLEALGKRPILSLGMRLGEGSGGATAALIVKAALATHAGMASFAEAGVARD